MDNSVFFVNNEDGATFKMMTRKPIFSNLEKQYIIDIDMDKDIDCLVISNNVWMHNTEKSFKSVKKLVINEGVKDIQIPNSLFPNVVEIESFSKSFRSGNCLVYVQRYGYNNEHSSCELLNTFCKKEDAVIDLEGIRSLASNAFSGCESTLLINASEDIDYDRQAFENSGFMKLPFVNNLKMVENVVLDVDVSADEIDLPDHKRKCIFAKGIALSKIKKLICHNYETLTWYNVYEAPQNIVFDTDEQVSESDMHHIVHLSGYRTSAVKHATLTAKVKGFKEIDGVVYNDDMTRLIACSQDVKSLIIPEGIISIMKSAFDNCDIESVKLPDSLKKLETFAFANCKNLEKVDFGTGLEVISNNAFEGCERLHSVELPPQIRAISNDAFERSGLESIVLNDGLKRIGNSAFDNTKLVSVTIPKTVDALGWGCLGRCIKTITFNRRYDSVMSAFAHTNNPSSRYCGNDDFIKIWYQERKMYVPRYIKPNMYDILKDIMVHFFNSDEEYLTSWSCAYSKETREDIAIMETADKAPGDTLWTRREDYLKKNSKRIAVRLLCNGDEEKAVIFLKLGFVSKITLKELLKIADEKELMTVKSYLLEQLGENVTKQNFYL